MLNQNLATIRGAWKMSQQEFADLMEVTVPMYRTYESGSRRPDMDFMCDLEDKTGILVKRLWRHVISVKELPDKPLSNVYENNIQLSEVNEESAVWKAIKEINTKLETLAGSR